MTADEKDLIAEEGVNQGSSDATDEAGNGGTAALDTTSGDGHPAGESDPAPPRDTESTESRAARDAAGPGQQLEAGEG